MSFRLSSLCRCLLALLFLAGVAGVPAAANARATGVALAQHHQAGRLQAPSHHVPGRPAEIALDAAWADADDDPKPLALAPVAATPDRAQAQRPVIAALGCPTPLSHWPCAGTPTGPPRS